MVTTSPTEPRSQAHAAGPWRWRAVFPAAAAVLLLPALVHRGIAIHDEGHFLLAAHTVLQGALGLLRGLSPAEIREVVYPTGGTLYLAAKPGHILLLALTGLLSGGLSAAKGLWPSVVATLGIVWLTQEIAARRFGPRAGLLAGAMCLLCPLTLLFGASALGLSTSCFFGLLAFRLLDSEDAAAWRLKVAGIAAVASFTCHYNAAPLLIAMAVGFWPKFSWRQRLTIAASALAALLVFEGTLMAADRILQNAYPDFRSFFGELHYNFTHHQAGSEELSRDGVRGYGATAWLFLLGILAIGFHWTGLAALIGLFWAWKANPMDSKDRWLLTWWLGFPLVFWILYPWKVERSFLQLVPAVAVWAGFCFDRGLSQWAAAAGDSSPRWWSVLGYIPLGGTVVLGLLLVLPPCFQPRSAYALAVEANEDWIREAPSRTFTAASVNWRTGPLWKWYLGPEQLYRSGTFDSVDFSTFDTPLVIAVDPVSHFPDSSYAGQAEAFEAPVLVGEPVVREGETYGFLTRSQEEAFALLKSEATGEESR